MRRPTGMALVSLTVLLSGCVPTYKYVPSGTTASIAAKPANCAFAVLTTRPDSSFDEIGILDHSHGPVPDDAAAFKKSIQKEVCRAGGDAVLVEVNGLGQYIRGTVLRFRVPVSPAQPPPATP
jgi:hypothetical protein